MVPNSVLSEVMQMMPVEAIKVELDTERSEFEEAEYPQMEGREEDDENKEKEKEATAYLSMNNSRNFVCEKCDAGFTFVRSYRWHLARCTQGAAGAARSNNIPSQSKAAAAPVIVCKICQASVTGLKSHLSLVHFKSQLLEKFSSSPRKCNICNKSFKSIHSLILHIGIHHGMVKKLSQSSNPILKRKMVTSGKQSQQTSNSKYPDKSSSTAAANNKEKNSLYKASLMKKKFSSNNSVGGTIVGKNNSLYRASQMNKLMMSKSSSQIVSPKTPSKDIKKSPLKKPVDTKSVANNVNNGPGVIRKAACGACVKCLLPDCGECAQCAGGGAPGLQRLCVKKVCRNKIWTSSSIDRQ